MGAWRDAVERGVKSWSLSFLTLDWRERREGTKASRWHQINCLVDVHMECTLGIADRSGDQPPTLRDSTEN